MMATPPAAPAPLLIGVLALTGSFEEHEEILRQLGAKTRQVRGDAVEVKTPADLVGVDGIIFPGGESTAMGIVDAEHGGGLFGALRHHIDGGLPVYGTCAGLILLADLAEGLRAGGQPLVGGLDVTVCRNYFGAQVSSFEVPLTTEHGSCKAVFIRAPAILEVGPAASSLASLKARPCAKAAKALGRDEANAEVPTVHVAVRQKNILATAFHPELTNDSSWHQRFLDMCQARRLLLEA